VKTIGLLNSSLADQPLFDWLSKAFAVRFEERHDRKSDALDAWIMTGFDPAARQAIESTSLPSLLYQSRNATEKEKGAVRLSFCGTGLVPAVFRGREVEQNNLGVLSRLGLAESDAVLASVSADPVWIARQAGGRRIDTVAMSLPPVDASQILFDHFQAVNFARLLPLVDFLRRITEEAQWQKPCRPACFMFDDLNLHAAGYGWLDYTELSRHAARHNYHVSFATVPLDAWYDSRQAVALLAKPQSRLSLLIHGNDHISRELATYPSEEVAIRSLAQGLRRVAALEKRTGAQVARVMAAPHSACTEEVFHVMARLAYEAGCFGHGSLRRYNRQKSWTQSLGAGICTMIGGFPVLPRFRFTPLGRNAVLLAAYLDQPIIPYGHHQDVSGGLGLLDDLADFINSLGDVRWMDMRGVARANFQTRCQNGVLHLRPFPRVFKVQVPPDMDKVAFDCQVYSPATGWQVLLRAPRQPDKTFFVQNGEPFSVPPGSELEVKVMDPNEIDANLVPAPKPQFYPIIRRHLCEARDRIAPAIPVLGRRLFG